MTEPAFQPFAAAFHCMVVPEASTSPAMFSRTLAAPSNTRSKSRPPSAPPTSQCVSANSLAEEVSTTKGMPRLASSSSPRDVAAIPSSPLKHRPASVVAAVVEVASVASFSTPISVALCRKAAARRLGHQSQGRTRGMEPPARRRLSRVKTKMP